MDTARTTPGALVIRQEDFGVEGITAEDRAYNGSRFSDVRDAIFANPYQKIWGRDDEPPLPFIEPTLSSLLRGFLPFGKPYYFGEAAKRTVDSHADLRWGGGRKRIPTSHPSEWRMPDRPLGDYGIHRIYGLLQEG